MVTPFPSLPEDHLCRVLISAIVVEQFGVTSYWLSSRTLMTAGFTKPLATNSTTLETQGIMVTIGLNSFLMSHTGLSLGRGITSAFL